MIDKEAIDKKWYVVGFTRERAEEIILDIEKQSGKDVSRKVNSLTTIWTQFDDGTKAEWIRANDSIRGCRIGKMWCDKTIDKRILNEVIYPKYFGKKKDIVWL